MASRRTRHWIGVAVLMLATAAPGIAWAQGDAKTKFKRIKTQYIAALATPDATFGSGAERWGIWRHDPGPRGVDLGDFPKLAAKGGVTPDGWTFDAGDWWLEENGLIMEQPTFPLPAGKYVVTGDRETTSVLTVEPPDGEGVQHWALANGAMLHDVTHLACRSARYRPAAGAACSPAAVPDEGFPVDPGAEMPPVKGCGKQDYAVLFVIGVAVDN